MPIVQVRPSRMEQYLYVPTSFRGTSSIIAEWSKDARQTEMFVYPPDYLGDITPLGWDKQSFILHVDQSGEQAQMKAIGTLRTAEEAAEALEHLRTVTPEQASSIGTVATVNEHNQSAFVATAVASLSTLAIGGIVSHVRAAELGILKNMFQTTEIE